MTLTTRLRSSAQFRLAPRPVSQGPSPRSSPKCSSAVPLVHFKTSIGPRPLLESLTKQSNILKGQLFLSLRILNSTFSVISPSFARNTSEITLKWHQKDLRGSDQVGKPWLCTALDLTDRIRNAILSAARASTACR